MQYIVRYAYIIVRFSITIINHIVHYHLWSSSSKLVEVPNPRGKGGVTYNFTRALARVNFFIIISSFN